MLCDHILEFCSHKKLFNDKFKSKREIIKNQVFLSDDGIEKIINLIKS